jgi:hypothetical protein
MATRYVRIRDERLAELLGLPSGSKVVEVAAADGQTFVRFEHESYPELPPEYCHEVALTAPDAPRIVGGGQ